jgi:hypothetical protein
LIIALCLWFVSFTFHTITYIKIASIHGQGWANIVYKEISWKQ